MPLPGRPGPGDAIPVHLLGLPHHDGSPAYVDGDPATGSLLLTVRAPSAVQRVQLRWTADGEPHFRDAAAQARGTWAVELPVRNPVTGYRFLVDGHTWLNGTGVHERDVSDVHDFRATTHPPAPGWARDATVYQVFPDRFARGAERTAPPWAHPARWDDPVDPTDPRQWYGGDLDGITAHLDHLRDLGADVLYLTPFFPAESSHRYNASDFHAVDPCLGGEAALARLTTVAHDLGIRVVGDLTTNHCGDTHPWFRAALADPEASERAYFFWDDGEPVYWLGVPTLPKFDHRAPGLRERLYAGPGSVLSRWLEPPYDLDGWRIDVANMTARYGEVDLNVRIAREIRAGIPEGRLLIGEHAHDYTRDVLGDGWHGTMDYAGFSRPVWSWLAPADTTLALTGMPVRVVRRDGAATVAAIRDVHAQVPWQVQAHSMTLLGSHDTFRIRTLVRERHLHAVAVGVLATMPGVPMVFAGDEIGLEGTTGEGARTPFPWHRPETWDTAILATYRRLLAVRRGSVALRRGGLRWAHVGPDSLTYLREHPAQTVLVHVARAPHPPVRLPLTVHDPETLYGDDLVTGADQVTLPADGPAVHVWRV